MTKPEDLIVQIRDSVPNAEYIFTCGNCFKFYKTLKMVYNDAKAFYDHTEAHVYTRIGDRFFDIHGVYLGSTAHFEEMSDEFMAEAENWTYDPFMAKIKKEWRYATSPGTACEHEVIERSSAVR